MNGHAQALNVGYKGVLPRQQVRHLELEARPVKAFCGAHQESLGPTTPEALGEPEDAGRR